ncbi:CWF19-like protein 2 [Clytia hemisphaerica]
MEYYKLVFEMSNINQESLVKFVSKSNIDAKKKSKTDHLKEKLKQTREDYESVKRRKNLEEERGDSKWMLPSLSDRIESDDRKEKKKKKNEKKEKKKKHKKKSKKHKHKSSKHSDSSSEEEVSDDEWEEAGGGQTHQEKPSASPPKHPKETPNVVERDDWMLSSSLLDVASKATYSREHGKTKQRKTDEKQKEKEKRATIQASRELNPYWKNGGTGLPSDSETRTQAEVTQNHKVGDGGKSWLQKSYDRAVKQAKEQGVPVEDIISKRYGSMEKFNALLKAAERTTPRSSGSSNQSSSSGGGGGGGGGSWRKSRPQEKQEEDEPKKKPIERESRTHHSPEQQRSRKHVKEYSSSDSDASASSSGEEEEAKEEFEMVALSEKEKNEISAKILRAELMGNDELAEELKGQLESGHRKVLIKSSSGNHRNTSSDDERGGGGGGDHEVILTRTDKHGNLLPVQLQTDTDELNRKRKRKKKIISTHDADGKRTKYFEDDDNMDLKALVQQERMTTSDDQTAQMARLASKHLGKTQGDDYTLDDMFVTASATKGSVRNEDKRTKEKAVKEHKQRELQLASCRFCFENPKIAKHLIIAIGRKTYLALPIHKSLTEGHCLILPLHHVIGQTYMDEDVLQEIKLFKDSLVKMFSKQDQDVVFMETCKNLRHQNHCVIECVPIEKELGDLCPIYFKKALMEAGSEWSQNKKIVNITNKDGVSKAIPKGLPYFSVEFGKDGGYGHVIEDEESFSHYFGKEIMGGMMDLEPVLWRKPPKQSFDLHKRKVLKFSEEWKQYDWTKELRK